MEALDTDTGFVLVSDSDSDRDFESVLELLFVVLPVSVPLESDRFLDH